MPIISTFFGIVIGMYYQEHEPAHFRPNAARRLSRDWTAEHRAELDANWARMTAGQALERIRPLE
jgi:hypothetical protein